MNHCKAAAYDKSQLRQFTVINISSSTVVSIFPAHYYNGYMNDDNIVCSAY